MAGSATIWTRFVPLSVISIFLFGEASLIHNSMIILINYCHNAAYAVHLLGLCRKNNPP